MADKSKKDSSNPGAPRPVLKDIRDMARWLLTKGLVPLPLPNGQKRPLLEGWETATVTVDRIDELFTDGCNIGLRLDKWTDIDLDAPESCVIAPFFLKPNPARWGRQSARNSHHLYDVENSRYEAFIDPAAEGSERTLLEIRHGSGHQSMLPPSVHPSGESVRWEASTSPVPEKWTSLELRRAAGKIAAAVLLVRHLKRDSNVRHWVWFYLGGAMRRAEWSKEEALYFVEIVTRASSDEQLADRRNSVESSFVEGKTEIAGLKKLEDYLPKPIIRKLAQWLDLRRISADPLDLSDDDNARFIFAEHSDNLHHLPNEGKGGLWVFWNDVIWQRDRSSYVSNLAANSLKKKADQLTEKSRDAKFINKVRQELLNVSGVSAAMERLSWYQEIYTPSDAFDNNPWLVGLQNGIYNLQLDRLETGTREHLVSRQMNAGFEPDADCPRWLACLKRAQPDAEVREFLQRLAGSCLLGMQTEHGFVFNYGKGANFKTAFAEMLRRVLGPDYAGTPNEELFFKGNQEVPRNYVADIHGMRLLTANEKNEGSEWNIEFIKRLFGGQQLNACRKYCESFSFIPTARVIVAANNKPRLNELDEATRRRFLLVPWEETIPGEGEVLNANETDQQAILRSLEHGARMPFEQLMALLLEERNGFLNWVLSGAQDFIKRGLRLEPPASILSATSEYFESEDLMGRFVNDWAKFTKIPDALNDEKLRAWLRNAENATDDHTLHTAFTLWAKFGKHAWSRSKVSRRLAKVDGVRGVRGYGNRLFFNLVLTVDAKLEIEGSKREFHEQAAF